MNVKTKITKLHYDKNAKGIFILDFVSFFYGIASCIKNFLYDKHIISPKSVDACVISVGNITTGGVGKTPVVSKIAEYLLLNGNHVAIVSRGYGGRLSNKNVNIISDGKTIFYDAKQAGDEPYWLAENTKGVQVLTCKDRYKACEYAVKNFNVKYIVLDDGFQHRKLKRDLDIVLTDSEKGFGNEKLLPAGPLREGFEAFKRIDRLVVVSKNVEHSRAEKLAKIMSKKSGVPSFVCKNEPDVIYNIKTGAILPKNLQINAVCAIGQPEQFYAFLTDYDLKSKLTFADHHIYNEEELPAGIIVTTEKDAVKMLEFSRDDIYALKLKISLDVENLLK